MTKSFGLPKKKAVTFEQLTVNTPFLPEEEGYSDDVMVKIDDSRFIFIGTSGAWTVLDREILVSPL